MGTEHTPSTASPKVGTPTPPGELPDAITFFVTRAERNAALRALRAIDRDRGRALLRALGIDQNKRAG